MINGTVIAVHESTSEKNRKNRTVEACYIFRSQSSYINHYTKVVILLLYHLKAGWVDSPVPVPSSSMTTATTTAPEPSFKTMVSTSTKLTKNEDKRYDNGAVNYS